MPDDATVNVRILVDDVAASVDFYTRHFGFTTLNAFPAFADVQRGHLRLLLSGPKSSAAQPMSDGEQPKPGGWNRIHFIVEDLDAEIARLRDAGVSFRNEVVRGPAGRRCSRAIRPATSSSCSSPPWLTEAHGSATPTGNGRVPCPAWRHATPSA